MKVRVPKQQGESAAQMLDALSAWILRFADEVPIRSAFQDDRLVRAAALSNERALQTYRATRSTDVALEEGKKAFLANMSRFGFSDPDLPRTTSQRSTPELWTDPRDDSTTATG